MKFNAYAATFEGMPAAHELDKTLNTRVDPPTIDGGPNCPVNPAGRRVSATRHGVIGKKAKPTPLADPQLNVNGEPTGVDDSS